MCLYLSLSMALRKQSFSFLFFRYLLITAIKKKRFQQLILVSLLTTEPQMHPIQVQTTEYARCSSDNI